MASILYISYTGLLDPLGESQVLQYVRELACSHRMTLLTFEKAEALADALADVAFVPVGLVVHGMCVRVELSPRVVISLMCGMCVGGIEVATWLAGITVPPRLPPSLLGSEEPKFA